MRLLLLASFVIASCAPRVYADTFVKRGFSFGGPRWVTITGERREDLNELERELSRSGFRGSRGIPGVTSQLATRYVLNVTGGCPNGQSARPRGTRALSELTVEGFEATVNERVFAAHLADDSPSLIDTEACPNKFFRE